MVRGAKEDPIDFADRCKSAIARAGGLVDRVWDGNLKVKSQFLKNFFKGSSDPSHFVFHINVGKKRIRHGTTLKLNF